MTPNPVGWDREGKLATMIHLKIQQIFPFSNIAYITILQIKVRSRLRLKIAGETPQERLTNPSRRRSRQERRYLRGEDVEGREKCGMFAFSLPRPFPLERRFFCNFSCRRGQEKLVIPFLTQNPLQKRILRFFMSQIMLRYIISCTNCKNY